MPPMLARASRCWGCAVQTQARRWVSRRAPTRLGQDTKMGPAMEGRLNTMNAIAKQLHDEELWLAPRGPGKKTVPREGMNVSVDHKRVNIVNDRLCHDIIEYLGPSIDRHKGCDLIDLNPGIGIWSTALNDVLQPRTHVLLEPDKEFYRPYLEDLLDRPGTELMGESGIEWQSLERILPLLKHQRQRERSEPQERNDTLLMTANISWYPNRPWPGFVNVGDLIMFQLLNSIRLQTLFQKYGLVRMLVWVRDDQQAPLLPRSIKYRGKPALDGELTCEWIRSVAEPDHAAIGDATENLKHKRDRDLDHQSSMKVLQRMRENGIVMPEHRKSTWFQHMEEMERGDGSTKKGGSPATIINATIEQLDLEAELKKKKKLSEEKEARLKYLLKHAKRRDRESANFGELLREWQLIPQQPGEKTDKASKERDLEWNAKVKLLHSRQPVDFRNILANYHLFHQDPPVLHWDRRTYEPLRLDTTDFFPNVPCCLLDIQPKVMHPLMRETGRGTTRASDMMFHMAQTVGRTPNDPVLQSFNAIYPGAGKLAMRCPSFTDPKLGGMCGTGQNQMFARVLSERQWIEFLEAYMKWPFRMDYPDLISRLSDVIDSEIIADNAMGRETG